jgi:diamine N-acetyltransferase
MDLTLREITADNWQQCIQLRVSKKQIPFIPSNIFSLAESKFLPERVPLGIYDGDTMIGMVVCSYTLQHGRAWIHRLMIDENFQNKGYSRGVMQKLLQRLTRMDGCKVIGVDWRPGNSSLEKCYTSFGFQKTGQRTNEGDIVAILRLNGSAESHADQVRLEAE